MYVIDDICYAGTPGTEIRVVDAKPLVGGMMLLQFSTGERRLFDCVALEGRAYEPLKDREIFEGCEVVHGFVSWADGAIDVAPEYLYENSLTYAQDDDLLLIR